MANCKRKERLSKATTKCKEIFHVGNLVTDYELPSSAPETSQELAPLTQNIYRVIRVDHLTARVVNLFTGQSRTLPKNHLRRLYISDLTNLRYFCTNRYLQNMQHKLYKQNKLTSSDQSKTWLQLLRKPSQTHIDIPYSDEEISKDEEADIDEELGCVNTAEDLTADKPEEITNTLDAIDFSKEDDDPLLGFEPTQPGRKCTRSGKAYKTSVFPKKILKKTRPSASFS